MWRIKVWTFTDEATMAEAHKKMEKWLLRKAGIIQWHQVFVNNAFAVEYRPLRIIG